LLVEVFTGVGPLGTSSSISNHSSTYTQLFTHKNKAATK
jgi:hypothetical protein